MQPWVKCNWIQRRQKDIVVLRRVSVLWFFPLSPARLLLVFNQADLPQNGQKQFRLWISVQGEVHTWVGMLCWGHVELFFIPEGLSTKRRSGQEGPQQFASDVVLPRYLQTSLPTSSPSLWKLRRCHSYPHSKIELLVTQRHVSKVKITTSDPSLHADCYNELTLVDLVAIGNIDGI